MSPAATQPVIDYLAIGHASRDLTPDGPRLGGSVTYAALTARALGLRVGIVTSAPDDFGLWGPLAGDKGISLVRLPAANPTTFENRYDAAGHRQQTVSNRAAFLDAKTVPAEWRRAPIVHMAPIIAEVDPALAGEFPASLVGATLQGWLRDTDERGNVRRVAWHDERLFKAASAAILSTEDVNRDETTLHRYAHEAHMLVVTLAHEGCRVHWQGEERHIPAPQVELVDPTGAGDIFAAAFLYRLRLTQDPFEAGRFAVQLASASVTRMVLDGVPTMEEIGRAMGGG